MPSAIEILITARDEASKTLEGVRSQLVVFDQFGKVASDLTEKVERNAQSFNLLEVSARTAARGVRNLAVPIAAELAPALGQLGQQFSGVLTAATLFGTGMTAVAVGAATLAGIVGGKLVEAYQQGRTEIREFNAVLGSGDFARVTSEVDRNAAAIQALSERWRAAKKEGFLSFLLESRGGLALGPNGSSADVNRKLDENAKLREEEKRLRDAEAPGMSAAELNAILGANARETFSVQQGQRGLYDFALPGPYATREQQLRAADDLERAGHPEAAARLRAAAGAQFGRTQGLTDAGLFARPTPGAVSDYDTGPFFGEAAQGQVLEQQRALRERDLQREIELLRNQREVLGEHAVSDYGGVFFGPEGQAESVRSTLEVTQRLAEVEAKRAETLLQIGGLSKEQQDALRAQTIELQLQAQLADDRLSNSQKSLVELQAQVQRLNLARDRAIRDDPRAGFVEGLRIMEDDFGSAGLRMQEVARSIADGMSKSFSDGFFDVITGNFKDLPNVARGFTQSMVRAVTDELAKLVTAPILGTLRSLFTAGSLSALSVLPGAGAGSGGGPLSFLGPGTAEAATAPLVSVAGRPITNAEINIAYTQAGDQGVRQLQQGQATVSNGAFFPLASGNGELPGPSIPAAASPSLLSRALPIAGNAAAFGLSAYGATGAHSAADVGISAALGGLTGAGLGRSIGSIFDAGGAGAGIGALGGAAINASLALVAKQEADKAAEKQRQAAEAARAAGAGGDLVSSAGGASSLADLFRRISAFGSGYTGGSANPAVPVSVQTAGGPAAVGTDASIYPVGDVLDILRNPGSLQANIQAGVNPSLLEGPNATTSKALQDRATDLVSQFRQSEQGVGVSQQDLVPGGLTRRTTVPASRVDQLSPTADLTIDELALNALSDDDKAVLLLDVLSRVAADKDIQSTISDGATGQIVSITRMARQSVGLPPVTTPVPAPVTTGTPSVTPPGATTTDLLTAGGAISLGLATQLADPKSILNAILPAGYTGPELATALSNLFTAGSLSGGAGTVALGDLEAAGRDLFTPLSDLSTTPGVGFGDALAGIGGLIGLYNLVLGAQAADPASIVQGTLSVYSALSSIAPATFTPISTVLGSAFATIAPETAAALTGTTVGATTGAEVASAAIAAAAPWIAVAAPILFWAAMKLTEPGPSDAWAIVGSTATALQTQARTSIAQANATFAALRSQRVTDPAMIQGALSMGANALYNYYRVVQNPRGGTISVATFYAYTKQDPTPLQNAAALLQQNMKDAVAELSRQGVSPAALGNLAPSAVAELIKGQPYSDALKAAPKIVPGGQPIMNEVQVGEGTGFVDTGQVTQPTDQTQNVNQGIAANAASGRLLPNDTVNAEYGGPLWALFRYLAGPSASGYDVQTPTITGAQPWLAGGATPGTVSGPTAQEAPLADWEITGLLAIAAMLQAALTSGGGPGAPGPSAGVGMPGDNGEGLGDGSGNAF